MRMIRWMCRIQVTDRFIYIQLRERFEVDDIIYNGSSVLYTQPKML